MPGLGVRTASIALSVDAFVMVALVVVNSNESDTTVAHILSKPPESLQQLSDAAICTWIKTAIGNR